MNNSRPHGRRTLVLITLLFMAPILLAMWLRFGAGDWQPATGNHGALIQPPVPAQALEEIAHGEGYWLMLQLVPHSCTADCAALSDAMRRIRVALGADTHRVKWLRVAPGSSLRRVLEDNALTAQSGAVFLADPRGFLIMRYEPGFDPNGLLDDLERLLRYGKVGVQ